MCWTRLKFNMREHDAIRLRHMIDSEREAISLARGRVRDDLETDRQLPLSLFKKSEIIGEAASQVTDPTRQELAGIPWNSIIAMRNRLVHACFSINLDILWSTVQQDLPGLIDLLERSVPPESHQD